MKSSTAAPCFRNSGLLTTLNGCVVSRRIDVADLRGGADRHRALVDDDRVAVHRPADVARHAEHVLQVGRAVLALRRADGDEDDLGGADGLGQVGRERQPLLARVAPDQLLEPRLVDRHPPAAKHPDLRLVLVDADDVVAVLGEAGAHDQPDVAGSDDRNFHPRANSRSLRLQRLKRYHSVRNAVNILTSKDFRVRHSGVVPGAAALLAFSTVRILLDYRPALQGTDRGRRVRPRAGGRPGRASCSPATSWCSSPAPGPIGPIRTWPPAGRGRGWSTGVCRCACSSYAWHRLGWPRDRAGWPDQPTSCSRSIPC